MFDRSFIPFYTDASNSMATDVFSLRCLFLDSDDESVVENRAQDIAMFKESLIVSIMAAAELLQECNIEPEEVCRMYTGMRNDAFLIVDDFVLYTPLRINDNNRPLHYTNAPFDVMRSSSPKGQNYENIFEKKWNASKWKQVHI